MEREPTQEQHAREILKKGFEWRASRLEAVVGGVLVTGFDVPSITRGPRKGRPNWRKADRQSRATVVLTDEGHRAWLLAWEVDTGRCHHCRGTGQKFASWHHINGFSYAPCSRCNATGNAPQQEPQKARAGGETK